MRATRSRRLREDGLVLALLGAALAILTVSMFNPADGHDESLFSDPPVNAGGSTSGTPGANEIAARARLRRADRTDETQQPRPASAIATPVRRTTDATAAAPGASATPTTTHTPAPRGEALPSRNTAASSHEGEAPPSPLGWHIEGRVLDETGHPLPGIEIIATSLRTFGSEQPADLLRRASTLSAFDGRFAFDALAHGEYRIESTQTRGLGTARTTVRAGVSDVTLMLTNAPSVWVQGTVTDRNGAPLASASIESTPRESLHDASVSDDGGHFGLDLVLRGDRRFHTLRFQKPGYRSAVLRIDREAPDTRRALSHGTPLQLDVPLEPLQALTNVRGTVTTASGEVVEGEAVRLHSPKQAIRLTAVTDGDGNFTFADVPPSDDYRLRIRSAGRYHEFLSDTLQVARSGVDVAIALAPMGSGSMMGQMVDATGAPVSGFSLWVRSQHAGRGMRRVTSDVKGYFVAEDVPEGPLVLGTRSSPRFDITGVSMTAGSRRELTLVLDQGSHLLEGLIVDMDGRPVAAADLKLTWAHAGDHFVSRSKRTMSSDRDGYFQFTGLGPGPHRLQLDAQGFQPLEVVFNVEEESDLVLLQLMEASL
jgi:protocatechuate 3,4-dioxygenase beta subunit